MALLKYLKPCDKDGLPDPKKSLTAVVPSRAIAQANQEVQQTLGNQSRKSKKLWYHLSIKTKNKFWISFSEYGQQ